MAKNGLAIRLPDRTKSALERVRRNKWISLHARPLQLQIPGGTVALVGPGGYVELIGQARALVGPRGVRLLNGASRENGFRLELSHLKRPPEWSRLDLLWRAVGQFRYFDPRNWKAVIVGERFDRRSGDYLEYSGREVLPPLPVRSFAGGIPGLPRNAPESRLVRDYVEWIGSENMFVHHFIRSAGLYEDLFDKSYWRLIEAKVSADRTTVRTALGQLLDYKRYHSRAPSLGILLGERPTNGVLDFVKHYKVTAIWQTTSRGFGDSADGYWTRTRRV